jgi:hypothetical protein
MAEELRTKNLGPGGRQCPADSCDKPEEAAHRAVKQVFAILGVDVDRPDQVERFREGLRFGEAMHKYAKYGMLVMVGVMAAALSGAVIVGALEKIKCYVAPGGNP